MSPMHQYLRMTTVTFSLAMSLIVQSGAMADFLVLASSRSNMGGDFTAAQSTSGSVFDVAGGTLGSDFTDARASASFGQLRAYSEARSGTNPAYFGVFSMNTASFRDDFLFESIGRAGTAGTVQVKFTIDGNLAVSRTSDQGYQAGIDSTVRASASYTFSTGLNRASYSKTESLVTSVYAATEGISEHGGSPFLGIEQTYTVPFTFGTTLEGVGLSIDTLARSIGRPNFASSALADLSHTANWGGFGEVRDANGNLVTDYTFTSSSGFNYTQSITAVPEPSSIVLGMIGSSAFLLRLRKRKAASHLLSSNV